MVGMATPNRTTPSAPTGQLNATSKQTLRGNAHLAGYVRIF